MSHDPRWRDDARQPSGDSRDLSRSGRGGPDARHRERVDPRDVFVEHVACPAAGNESTSSTAAAPTRFGAPKVAP